MRRFFFIAIVLLFVVSAPAQGKHGFRHGDVFQAEGSIKKPVKLPKGVLSRAFKDHSYPDQSLAEFEKAVTGTFVDLNGDRKDDFLVQGDIGANVTGYWLFQNVGGRQQLVLYTRALGIQLLGTSHNGMRDIEGAAATAVTLSSVIYRFGGTKYRPYRCWSEDLGFDAAKRKKTFYPCDQ